MKACKFCSFAVILITLAVGCRSMQPTDGEAAGKKISAASDITADELNQVEDFGKSIMQRIVLALEKNDFQPVKDLPVGSGQTVYTQSSFEKLAENVRKNGGISQLGYLCSLNNQPYCRLFWKVSFQAGLELFFELQIGKINGEYRIFSMGFHY